MKTSNYAETLIDSIMLRAWERGAYADTVLGYDEEEEYVYQKKEVELLMTYIATLEAEVEALRLHRNQEAQISEMRRVGNLMADHLNALGISRHDRDWADASNVLPEMIHENKDEKLPNSERKPDPLEGVPYVSLSNAEIAAMTPDHPLYKLVKGKEERNGQ